MTAADPPIEETSLSLVEMTQTVRKLKGKKIVCNISTEMVKARGEATIHGLYTELSAVWLSDAIPLDWKKG